MNQRSKQTYFFYLYKIYSLKALHQQMMTCLFSPEFQEWNRKSIEDIKKARKNQMVLNIALYTIKLDIDALHVLTWQVTLLNIICILWNLINRNESRISADIFYHLYKKHSLKASFRQIMQHLQIRDLPRFVDQVGHQTTNASIGNKYFFTK